MNLNVNKNILIVAVVFAAALGGAFLGGKIIIDKVSERVIEKMQRDYAPGPYHPGFDPDKVNPDFFRNQQPPNNYQPPSQPPNYQQPNQPPTPPPYPHLGTPQDWNKMWERMRS